MSADRRELLEALFDASLKDLLQKIKDDKATAAELNVARQLLKDNGINAIPTKSNHLGKLAEALPFKSADQLADEEATYQ